MRHSVALEHPPDGDRPGRRVAAVRVDEDRHVVSERRADSLDDCLGPSRPFVGVVPALLADADLDRVEPMLLAEPGEALRLVLGRDVPPHARGVRAQAVSSSVEQLEHALALDLPAQVPEGRVEAGQRAVEVGAGKLVLALGDLSDEGLDVERVTTQCMRRDLAMENVRGDVRVVRRDLTPALGAVVGAYANQRDIFGREALDADDLHASNTRTFRSASPSSAAAIASLTCSKG